MADVAIIDLMFLVGAVIGLFFPFFWKKFIEQQIIKWEWKFAINSGGWLVLLWILGAEQFATMSIPNIPFDLGDWFVYLLAITVGTGSPRATEILVKLGSKYYNYKKY